MEIKEFEDEWWIKAADFLKMNETLKKKTAELNKDIIEEVLKCVEELLLDVLYQACGEGDVIDNQCISAYEDACQFLEEKGMLKKINDRTYRVIRIET